MSALGMMRSDLIMRMQSARLYGILDMGYVDEIDMGAVAEALLKGGVGVLQVRAKGYESEEVIRLITERATGLSELCRAYHVPLIINDFPEAAVAVGADGIHVGQDDGSLEEVRAVVGEEMIIGRSTHSVVQASEAYDEGFDYIGYGPLFPTPTKEGRASIGLENIRQVQTSVGEHIPVFCIGGIKPENLELVLASGARSVVIVSALLQASDITAATKEVIRQLSQSF